MTNANRGERMLKALVNLNLDDIDEPITMRPKRSCKSTEPDSQATSVVFCRRCGDSNGPFCDERICSQCHIESAATCVGFNNKGGKKL